VGFLPSKGGARLTVLREVLGQAHSVVLFEAPHRIEELACELAEVLPAGRLTVCRELSKQFEEIATLDIAAWPAWLQAHPNRQRGEFVLVVHAVPQEASPQVLPPAMDAILRELVRHLPVKQAAGLVADAAGWPRKALYDLALQHRQQEDPEAWAPAIRLTRSATSSKQGEADHASAYLDCGRVGRAADCGGRLAGHEA